MSVNGRNIDIPLSGAFFWKRVKLEKIAEDFIDKVIGIAECVEKAENIDTMESSFNELSDYYYGVMESLEKYSLPFWWEDFFNVENELKSLVSQLIFYSNNINFIEMKTPFEEMIEREILILKDIKSFFKVMMSGKEGIAPVKESLFSHEKEFSEILKAVSQDSENRDKDVLYFPVVNIFERISRINENISESLGKITMGAAV